LRRAGFTPLLGTVRLIMEVIISPPIKCSRSQEFLLFPLGDIHAGSIDCSESAIKAKVEEIRTTKNALWLGMGDYVDSITKNDPRFSMDGLAPWVKKSNIIESQRKWVGNLFTPIKDKCLGLLTGNHEENEHLRYQNDITRNICDDLGVPYASYSAFFILDFHRAESAIHQVIVHAWHGAGAAQTEGARLMRLMRLVNEVQAHIYLMGHLHAMTQHTPDRLVCQRGRVKSIKLAATITGSWLKAYTQPKQGQVLSPTYAEMKGYKPSRIGCPVIHIRPDKEEFTVES